jgi:hypothetical protein
MQLVQGDHVNVNESWVLDRNMFHFVNSHFTPITGSAHTNNSVSFRRHEQQNNNFVLIVPSNVDCIRRNAAGHTRIITEHISHTKLIYT